MRPDVVFADPERVGIDALTAFTGVSADYPSVKLTGANHRIQVALETSSLADYPVTDRAQVRFLIATAPGKRTAAKALRDDVVRALYGFEGDSTCASITPILRSSVVTDPDTKNEICSVLARVTLKPALDDES